MSESTHTNTHRPQQELLDLKSSGLQKADSATTWSGIHGASRYLPPLLGGVVRAHPRGRRERLISPPLHWDAPH